MSSKKERTNKVRQETTPKNFGLAYLKIGVITFILGSIFIVGGLWIDHVSGKSPVFTITLTAIAFPLILLINYKIIKKSIEKMRS